MSFQVFKRQMAVVSLLVPFSMFANVRADFDDLQRFATQYYKVTLAPPGAMPENQARLSDVLSLPQALQLAADRNSRFRRAVDDLRLLQPTRNAACASIGRVCNPALEIARMTAKIELMAMARETRTRYWDAFYADQIQTVASGELEVEELQLAYARDLNKAGNANTLELARAVTSFQKQRLILAELQANRETAMQNLREFIGNPGVIRFPELKAFIADPGLAVPTSLNPEHVTKTHPEVQLAELQFGIRSDDWNFRSRNMVRRSSFESNKFPEFQTNEQLERDGSLVRLRQAERERDAIKIQIAERYAVNLNRWKNAAERIRIIQDELIPANREVQRQTLRRYNAMLSGVPELLEVRRKELEGTRLLLETLREFKQITAQIQYDTTEQWNPSIEEIR